MMLDTVLMRKPGKNVKAQPFMVSGIIWFLSLLSLKQTDTTFYDFVFPSSYKFIRECIGPATEGTLLFRLTLGMRSPCRAGNSMK